MVVRVGSLFQRLPGPAALFRRLINGIAPSGGSVSLPDGCRYYVVGDIHGCADLLKEIQRQILEDLRARPADSVVEIFLGDYIDRGPDSVGVLDILSADPLEGRERICLMGNHESLMLDFLSDPTGLGRWAQVGGLQTLQSYGIAATPTSDNTRDIQESLRSALPAHHLKFLRTLRHMHQAHGYAFVHAGVRPGIPLERQSEQDCMWIRDEFLDYPNSFGAIVVHGHTPRDQVEMLANRINIDTGAYLTGKLTCLAIDADGHRLLQTK